MIPGDTINLAGVNTLYHPDKGGATVVCDNLFRNLSDRFDVSFFNGRIDGRRPLLHRKKYRTGRINGESINLYGMFPANISSWIDGSLESNYYNPRMTPIFERFLKEHRPQIVHFHSLQWLGAQLIKTARESGAKTVVTMHDWWWVCPRQFLVRQDRSFCDHKPFISGCSCMDETELKRRTEILRENIQYADGLIVPSNTLRESLASSGFFRQPITVIENGINKPATTRSHRNSDDGPVVFSYLGTDSWLKGCDVLLEAAALLENEKFSLNMHGYPLGGTRWDHRLLLYMYMGVHAIQRPVRAMKKIWGHIFPDKTLFPDVPNVSYHPLFDYSELDDILAETDVVIIPSIQRESFSLVAREAMIRKIPVIISDCGGPEEIVRDNVNGLLFPTGDAKALSKCMSRIIHDRELLDRLAENINPENIPLISQQVREMEKYYIQLLPD